MWPSRRDDRGRGSGAIAVGADATRYPLLLQDLLIAYSHTGLERQSVALYERNAGGPRPFPAVTEAVALSYLAQQPAGATSADALQRVLRLRPGDLYANYHLRRMALAAGDQASAEPTSGR